MVLSRSRFKQDFEQIQREIESMYHAYIEEQITYPSIDTLSLHFTYLFLASIGCSQEVRQIYSVSQCLIQLGLDSHDQVEIVMEHDERSVTEQQLSVLSGDLFSGYYYLFLAEKNEIELIGKWANAIQEINIQKTDLHRKREKLSPVDYEIELNKLKKHLTKSVFTWFNASAYWHELFQIAIELETIQHQAQAQSDWKELVTKYQEVLNQYPEEWLKEELSLWLGEVCRTDLVLGG